MTEDRRKRVRDPVHGLIVFDRELPVEDLAWSLIDTREFQRLRRIRQLGVSEFTFPGAVHTRFSHSIGVFHSARRLVRVIEREIGSAFNRDLAEVAQTAALLHDLGHGPFSHAFEGVQSSLGVEKSHEKWSADIIRNEAGEIYPILEAFRSGFSGDVASLLESEDPEHIYHAIVSSSFDADRLDYLQRDKLMTGTGAGGIDVEWLIDNVRVGEIEGDAPDEGGDGSRRIHTFCLTAKAMPAAEQFLLARYTLHQQVYFHKTTRCVEHMLGKLIREVARSTRNKNTMSRETGLPRSHPLLQFFCSPTASVENYLALDDLCILGSLEAMGAAQRNTISDVANRILSRRLYKTLDLAEFGEDPGTQRMRLRELKSRFEAQIESEQAIIDDGAAIGIYSQIGGDDDKMHKKLHVLDGNQPREISNLSSLITALASKKPFTRVYFENSADRDRARGKGVGQ